MIQGDISKCFDKIPHNLIYKILNSKITCDKTIQLVRKSLEAGYIDPISNKLITTDIGTPQGSILSPLLSNIVLNELDKYMDELKKQFEKGKNRAINKEYNSLTSRIQNLQKFQTGSSEINKLARLKLRTPSTLANDPNFRRMMYLRYADDFVILITGSSDDAHMIRNRIKDNLLKKCGLELNMEKTKITNTKDGFDFLGASCIKPISTKAGLFKTKCGNPGKYRMRMRVMIPVKKLIEKLKTNKFIKYDDKSMPVPTARRDLINFDHQEIIAFFNHRILGLLNFYSFAHNLNSLRKIFMFLQFSCALTLALKFKLRTKRQVLKKYGYLLKDKETGAHLKLPSSLKVKHKSPKISS